MVNKIVARFADGRVMKGTTNDFYPNKQSFHINLGEPHGTVEIQTKDLKALFFVRDFMGNPDYTESNEFDPDNRVPGRRIKVVFKDGEVLVGTTTGYHRDRPGFFMIPADSDSNIERCYVLSAATAEISFL